jgi:hypothetical protein
LVAIELATNWLCRAQDLSRSADGGVARHYSLVDGWAVSYPETTGYIVPTVLQEAATRDDEVLRARARTMLDWLISIQFPEGGFQGGVVDELPRIPVTFNTGQILIGLAAGAEAFQDSRYLEATARAASWLVETQDSDGCWRRFPSPFASPGEKPYETHVSWGLFEAERVLPGNGFGDAGLKQVRWALTRQRGNGWFDGCVSADQQRPLTHSLGYVLRGILEGFRMCGDPKLLVAAERMARVLLEKLEVDGRLAGRFDSQWQPAASWVCLTGTAQIAHCWLLLAQMTGNSQYRDGARRANAFVRRTLARSGDRDIVGGVRGSWPITGEYGRYTLPNWAAKFVVDANRLEVTQR